MGPSPRVGLIMGSQSDWSTLRHAAAVLDELAIAHEDRIVSAHRTPERLVEYATTARARTAGDHRRRGRRRAPARDGRRHDHSAGARRAGGEPRAAGSGQPAVDRADARRRAGRHARDRARRRNQRRPARRIDPGTQDDRGARGGRLRGAHRRGARGARRPWRGRERPRRARSSASWAAVSSGA